MKTLYLISGIGPDESGTGRLLQHLAASTGSIEGWSVKILHRNRPRIALAHLLRTKQIGRFIAEALYRLPNVLFWRRVRFASRFSRAPAVLFHMQSLRTDRALDLLEAWRGPVFLFVLDAGVYCIRSYNHVFGDKQPCTACIGEKFEAADTRGCEPFPLPDPFFKAFVKRLPEASKRRGLTFLTQSESQTQLLARHFPPERVKTVGLWTADWNGLNEALMASPERIEADPAFDADVVFHGNLLPAKGFDWSLELARACPELIFLFPGAKAARIKDAPANAIFRPMTWETGLEDAVRRAKLTLVPSLWSASIEGALIKTILLAPRTAVIESPTAFQSELEDGLIFRLPPEPSAAAAMLRRALSAAPLKTRNERLMWFDRFSKDNRIVLNRIVEAVDRPDGGVTS